MNVSPEATGVWAAALVLMVAAGTRPRPPARTLDEGALVPPTRFARCRLRGSGGRSTLRRPGHRRRAVGPDAVAAWCDRLARALRTGSTPIAALHDVEPPHGLNDAFAQVRHLLDRGHTLDDALGHLATEPQLDLAITALTACRANGVDAALPLEQVASVLRWRAADAAELRAQSAQAKASSKVMTALPLAMLSLLVATSGMVRAAVVTPLGLVATASGVLLNLTGWAWMRHLIGRATR